MSLIQDALKRQAEETAGMRPPRQPVQPIQPSEPPPPPQQQQRKPAEKKKPKALPIVPFILLLIIFLVALLGLGFYLIKPKPPAVPKITQKSVPAEPVALPATPEPVKVPAAPVAVTEAAKKIETVIQPVTPPVAAEPSIAAEPVPKTTNTWPELKLTGIAQGDTQRLAILNGKMLTAGRKLGEVAVIQVRDSTVVVEYRGERRVMYIGE